METIELTVGHILKAGKFFNDPRFHNMPLDLKASMWIVKNARTTAEVINVFNERQRQLFQSLATMQTPVDGGPAQKRIPDEKMADFQQQIEEMLAEKVELEYSLIPAYALGDLKLTPKEVITVIYAIAEE